MLCSRNARRVFGDRFVLPVEYQVSQRPARIGWLSSSRYRQHLGPRPSREPLISQCIYHISVSPRLPNSPLHPYRADRWHPFSYRRTGATHPCPHRPGRHHHYSYHHHLRPQRSIGRRRSHRSISSLFCHRCVLRGRKRVQMPLPLPARTLDLLLLSFYGTSAKAWALASHRVPL